MRFGQFWEHVDKSGDCWIWTAGRTGNGYGSFSIDGSHRIPAHRVAYQLAFGTIPNGLWVLHHCDNRLCVNPNHLFLGTRNDNSVDMVAKGRAARGERNVTARLTREQVREIRAKYDTHLSVRELSREYGVCKSEINYIITKKSWYWLL